MILADTSVWIDYFCEDLPELGERLRRPLHFSFSPPFEQVNVHITNASAVKFLRTNEGHDLVVFSHRTTAASGRVGWEGDSRGMFTGRIQTHATEPSAVQTVTS